MTTSEPDPRTDLAGYLGLDADDIPDLTEEQCRDAYDATMADPDMPYLKGVIGRALIAVGWTPEEEA